jgi:hypothetical protein
MPAAGARTIATHAVDRYSHVAMDQKKCQVVIDGKECGLNLEPVSDSDATMLKLYCCPLGHRTHVVREKPPSNLPGGKIRDRKKSQ